MLVGITNAKYRLTIINSSKKYFHPCTWSLIILIYPWKSFSFAMLNETQVLTYSYRNRQMILFIKNSFMTLFPRYYNKTCACLVFTVSKIFSLPSKSSKILIHVLLFSLCNDCTESQWNFSISRTFLYQSLHEEVIQIVFKTTSRNKIALHF